MLKYWRVLLLIVMVLASVFAIGMKSFPHGRDGVEVVYISLDSPFRGSLEQGMIITGLNGEQIKTQVDWNRMVAGLSGGVSIIANGQEYNAEVNGSIGINVVGIERTNLDFGLDIRGGTRIILKPEGNITEEDLEQVKSVLETRANLFGLQEMKFLSVKDIGGNYFVQIEAAGVGSEVVDELLSRQGVFEAKVIKPVPIGEEMILGKEKFPVELLDNDTIKVNGSVIAVNDTFVLNEILFEYINKTDGNLIFIASVFEGEDIELVYTDPQRSGVLPQGNSYQFYFQILIALDGATRFADVTTGIPKYFDVQSGEEYIESSLLLYIDDQLVSSLRIGGSLGGKVIQSPQVSGGEPSMEEAINEKLRLQTILKSGALPVSLETLSVDSISPTLGQGFFDSALKAVILAGIVVLVIVFVRYRRLKISIPLVLIGLSEAVIILGISSTNDSLIWGSALVINLAIILAAWLKKHEIDVYAWAGAIIVPLIGMISWTIDLPAIAGIIAVIGTGVDHQIIIADEALKKGRKIYGIKEQLKRAFFIIMGAAATTIFAMLPLMFVGVGLVRGFAITTIVGVLVGILITRPAYARIVERFV